MMDFNGLANDIAAYGIERVFGIPGSGPSLSLIDALEKRGVDFCLTHFEGTGTLMAGTMGRLSGRAGISLSIKGPGFANAVPGLTAAWFESFPVVHLTEAAPPGAPASQAHKRLDHAPLVSGIAKGVRALSERGGSLSEMASWAEAETPGPVVLELAGSQEPPAPMPAARLTTGKADMILDLIEASQKPLVIAGSLAVRQGWTRRLNSLNIPVFCTAGAKGVVDETLPHAAGVYTGVGGELAPESKVMLQSDLVVSLGLTAREVLGAKPFPCKAVTVEAVETPGVEAFSFLQSSGIDGAMPVLDALHQKNWGLDLLSHVRSRLHSHLENGFLPAQVFQTVDRHFDGRVRAVMDTGYFCTIGEHVWPARRPEWCLLAGQSRYMGTGLPMALSAALHDRSVPTIAFLGDGGVGMYLSEAKIAARYRLPLLFLLMTDNAFGSIRTTAIQKGLTQSPLVMDGASWVGVFSAMGVPGERAENLTAANSVLAHWNPLNGPAFLEIPFDPDAYEAMVKGVR